MGKETVLALLLREKGHFVSGEAVSAELGITRAAIWKSISALRAQGYEIDAVTGRGYCLKSLPDTLTEQTVRSYLGYVETVGKRIDCFDSIDSTNAYLKRIALDGAPDGTVAVAAEQTSGRGRRGRSFQSAAGKGVYLSILLRPKLAPSQLMPLTGVCPYKATCKRWANLKRNKNVKLYIGLAGYRAGLSKAQAKAVYDIGWR